MLSVGLPARRRTARREGGHSRIRRDDSAPDLVSLLPGDAGRLNGSLKASNVSARGPTHIRNGRSLSLTLSEKWTTTLVSSAAVTINATEADP